MDWFVVTTGSEISNLPLDNPDSIYEQQDDERLEFVADLRFFDVPDKPEQHNKKIVEFSDTPPQPSYLHNFCIGPFQYKEKNIPNFIPMRIFYRRDYKDQMELISEKLFELQEKCQRFYSNFFGMAYNFEKMDLLFIPDAKYGAMEYPAAVTYKETVIPLDNINDCHYCDIARIIFHETAHMWFGNTVTMKWWNDLWLNESFAEYICFVCFEALIDNLSLELEDPWVKFFQLKEWGYREDAQVTTHPIAGDVINTEQAETQFDGITYSKGSSCMKQLVSLLSYDKFKVAIKKYFEKFKFRNATLFDLLEAQQDVINTEMKMDSSENSMEVGAYEQLRWKDDWQHTSGTNVIKCDWDRELGMIEIKQTCQSDLHLKLRFHKIKLGFYDIDANLVDVKEVIVQNQPVTVINYPDNEEIAGILPNYNVFFKNL